MKQTILFTGGGTAGHVTPNLALIQSFLSAGWEVLYAGSTNGIERGIIERLQVPYYGIATGKLRRYFSWRTFVEPFAIIRGILQAYQVCRRTKPRVIFSKGGYVAFPIVLGAWLNRIPVVVHESDLTPGLANKLSFPFANKIFVTYEEGRKNLPANKTLVTGNPIRESLLNGSKTKGLEFCQFTKDRPVLLILGGGQGSAIINQTIQSILPTLLEVFQVIHLCGKGKLNLNWQDDPRYRQFEYINDELADLFACSDLVVSRAGANSLYELLRLKKPHILIPLSRRASRGDQIINAKYFADRHLSNVIYEEELSGDKLFTVINEVYAHKTEQEQRLVNFNLPESNRLIYNELVALAKEPK